MLWLLNWTPGVRRILLTSVAAGLLGLVVGVALMLAGADQPVVLLWCLMVFVGATWLRLSDLVGVFRDAEAKRRPQSND